jgi:hypothetical protein
MVEFARAIEGQGIIDHSNCTYTAAELRALASAVRRLPIASRIIEIGTFAGRSASLYFQLQEAMNFDIHLIDNWSWNQVLATRDFSSMVIEHFSEVPFTLHKMRSDYLGTRWNLPIDLLHIDGWHDRAGIEPDCKLWLPWVVSGGLAVFHDSEWKDVADCIQQYVVETGWENVETAERTTVWRKP